MLPKDFENFELRLQKLREQSREAFEQSQKIFETRYERALEHLLPEDVLGTKKMIRAFFCIKNTEAILQGQKGNPETLLTQSVYLIVGTLPLTGTMRALLAKNILSRTFDISFELQKQQHVAENNLQKHPSFPIMESLFADGKLSSEEFLLLQHHYHISHSLKDALQRISSKSRQSFLQEQHQLSVSSQTLRKNLFETEYSSALSHLEKQGYQVQAVVSFVAQSYYRPKNRFESSKERLKRTWKMALLRLLQQRFGNRDIEALLERFENCESFEDFFRLVYMFFEILESDTETQQSFQVQNETSVVQDLLEEAEYRKEKILAGQQVTAKITDIISHTDTQLEAGILSHLLEDDTHFHGQEILFAHSDTLAGVYAEGMQEEEEDDEIDEIIEGTDTLQGKYEALKEYFFELDERKRKAFASGDYEEIDRINDILFRLDSQLQKLSLLLGEPEVL